MNLDLLRRTRIGRMVANKAIGVFDGMPHGGVAQSLRHGLTDFGSWWRGLINFKQVPVYKKAYLNFRYSMGAGGVAGLNTDIDTPIWHLQGYKNLLHYRQNTYLEAIKGRNIPAEKVNAAREMFTKRFAQIEEETALFTNIKDLGFKSVSIIDTSTIDKIDEALGRFQDTPTKRWLLRDEIKKLKTLRSNSFKELKSTIVHERTHQLGKETGTAGSMATEWINPENRAEIHKFLGAQGYIGVPERGLDEEIKAHYAEMLYLLRRSSNMRKNVNAYAGSRINELQDKIGRPMAVYLEAAKVGRSEHPGLAASRQMFDKIVDPRNLMKLSTTIKEMGASGYNTPGVHQRLNQHKTYVSSRRMNRSV